MRMNTEQKAHKPLPAEIIPTELTSRYAGIFAVWFVFEAQPCHRFFRSKFDNISP